MTRDASAASLRTQDWGVMSGYDKSPDYGGGDGGWKVAVLAALLFVAIAGMFFLPALLR